MIKFASKENEYIFYKYAYPVLLRRGFSWDFFPLTISDVNDCTPADGVNWNKPHVTINKDGSRYIYLKFIPRSLLEFMGLKEYQAYDPDGIEANHEYGHCIVRHVPGLYEGIKYRKPTPLWEEMHQLSGGKIKLDFGKDTTFPDYDNIIADEDFAEYFDDCITGKIDNEPFLQRIRELLGIRYVRMTIGDAVYESAGKMVVKDAMPKVVKGRTLTPTRHTHELLGDEVHYLDATKEVIIIRR